MSLRKIVFKTFNWQTCQDDEEEERFFATGVTEKNETVMIRIDGFTPFINIELPPYISQYNVGEFEYFLKSRLKNYKTRDEERDYAPITCKFQRKYDFYGKIPKNYLMCTFKTHDACKSLQYFLNYRGTLTALSEILGRTIKKDDFRVHEQNVDSLIKMTAVKKIVLGGWIEVEEYIPKEVKGMSIKKRKFSTCDIDMFVDYHKIKPISMPDTIQPRLKVMSWDIETYSENHNSKLPNPKIKENETIQISAHTVYTDNPENINKNLITIYKGRKVQLNDVNVINCKKEKEILLEFKNLIQKQNPDILLGYNILKFDWNYLVERADLLGIYMEFAELGRIMGERAIKVKKVWSSSAYSDQVFQYMEPQGRINLDLLPEIERSPVFKFDTYSLDFVSEFFLKDNKKPLSAKQMFRLYKFAQLTESYFDYTINKKMLNNIKKTARLMFDDDEDGVVKEYREKIFKSTEKTVLNNVAKALEIIGDYCVHDSILPIRLMFHLNVLFTLEQTTNIFNVPISYLQTRGQQVKGLAQVFRHTLYNNIVIPFKKAKDEDDYEGATVIEANPGFYIWVVTFDFMSLYPTTMIANNIDPTTYVDPNHPSSQFIKDSDCHVIEWETHIGCEHDKKIKPKKIVTKVIDAEEKPEPKKKKRVICGKFRHRFKKVVEKNGLLENEGVIPHILTTLLQARTQVKKEMTQTEKKIKETTDKKEEKMLKTLHIILDAKQLAIKVSMNSMYGMLGAKTGYIPLIPGAASVTAMGRQYIHQAIHYIKTNYPKSKLIYGDTDSCMINLGVDDLKEVFRLGKEISEGCSATYPKPMYLQFECVYGRFYLLTKKRYIAYVYDDTGKTKSITKKGVVTKRRDNTHYLKMVYNQLTNDIMNCETEQKVLYNLYDNVHKLFTRQIPDKDFVIPKGIKTIIGYAKTAELPDPSGKTITTKYTDKFGVEKERTEVVKLKYLIDVNAPTGKTVKLIDKVLKDSKGRPIEITDPLDPRLKYDNTAHIQLALRMIARGDDVPPNTRMQYVFLDTGNMKELQSNKVEDYTYYKENKKALKLRLDPLYYLEKQAVKPVTESFNVKFRQNEIKYVDLDTQIHDLEKIVFKLQPNVKEKVESVKSFILTTYTKDVEKECSSKNDSHSYFIKNSKKRWIECFETCKHSRYKNVSSMLMKRVKDDNVLEKLKELFALYYRKKSCILLDKIEKKFGIPKRKTHIPTRGHDIVIKDSKIMEDILRYRTHYREVVGQLNKFYYKIEFAQ